MDSEINILDILSVCGNHNTLFEQVIVYHYQYGIVPYETFCAILILDLDGSWHGPNLTCSEQFLAISASVEVAEWNVIASVTNITYII